MRNHRSHRYGMVYFVGAGPGDPGLITVRGAELLATADCVVYDRLVNPRLLELAPFAERFYAGKKCSHTDTDWQGLEEWNVPQEETNRLLVRLACAGKNVVRLKGGDPLIFGRGGEEACFLKKHGIRFEIVPGITAGYGAPAYAGIPLTDRRLASTVVFATGHEASSKKGSSKKREAVDWRRLAGVNGTLVAFMALENLSHVTQNLIAGGKPARTPVSVIEWGTLPTQRVVTGTLANIVPRVQRHKIQAPAVAVIGEVNRFRNSLRWFDRGPSFRKRRLEGKSVLITRPKEQTNSLRLALEREGAWVIELPVVEILPLNKGRALEETVASLKEFDWLLFTSVNGVKFFFRCLLARGRDVRVVAHLRIGVIGKATADALKAYGLRPDLIPPSYTSRDLFLALRRKGEIRDRSFLLPRADIAPPALKHWLESEGGRVREIAVYRTRPLREAARRLKKLMREGKKIDYVTFTSSSTVSCFFDMLVQSQIRNFTSRWVSIGPVTSETLKAYGQRPWCEAEEHTVDGLVHAMVKANK